MTDTGPRRSAGRSGGRTLVLWDVDHTLIDGGGIGRDVHGRVFEEVTGRRAERVAEMAGRTDLAIITDTLRLHGIEPAEPLVGTIASALPGAFAARRHEIADLGRELPGARAALAALAGRSDVVQSVLTGNMKPIAVAKLSAFGLDHFVDFEVGAYGLDGTERPPLVALARERAGAKYGEVFGPGGTVLIGDTPYDVHAGHQGGARVVAVATGGSDERALRRAGAELVLPDLTDTEAVVRAVVNVVSP